MSSSVAVFDDGLAQHDWPRPPPRNGDSRPYNTAHPLPSQSHFDAPQSWNQMPANQVPSFDNSTSSPFSAYHPTPNHLVSPSAPEFHQSRTQMGVQQYQQSAYAPHERSHHVAQSPYVTASDHPQSSPVESSAPSHYPRYQYDTPRPPYLGESYSSSSSNAVYGPTSSTTQPTAHPASMAGSAPAYDQSPGGDPDYAYVQSNATSLAYSEPVAPQPQRPSADFTQVCMLSN